jgi:hypothetical protein
MTRTLENLLIVGVLGVFLTWGARVDAAETADKLTQYGITWTFDKSYPVGKYVTGDWWVVGPVNITAITTDLHADGFTPEPGQNGSMVNPGTNNMQGYDNRLSSYDEKLNAGLGVSAKNPLSLKPHSSLVSMVSWLYRSEDDAEPGTPRFNGGTKTPRPVTRSGAVLTVVAEPPPEGSFRPPYCGTDKSAKFNVSQLDVSKLGKFAPVGSSPDPESLAAQITRPWIDHVHQFAGAMVHPSENMPNYGRDMALILTHAALVLNLDIAKTSKEKLLIPFVQIGVDWTGIADNGGGWPANGGHHLGRKLPILLAGLVLNDDHMKGVGKWDTRFQEDEQTFIVSQAEVDITHGSSWKPDKRGGDPEPYTSEDIGMPEWGIRHRKEPTADNREWGAPYRSINNAMIPGFALAARMMGMEEAWNHHPLFAYADRIMKRGEFGDGTNDPSPFLRSLWTAFEATRSMP